MKRSGKGEKENEIEKQIAKESYYNDAQSQEVVSLSDAKLGYKTTTGLKVKRSLAQSPANPRIDIILVKSPSRLLSQ